MLQSVNEFVENGKMVIAECGGMMYLGKEIINENSESNAMCGIFNISTSFEDKKLHLGYREITMDDFGFKRPRVSLFKLNSTRIFQHEY